MTHCIHCGGRIDIREIGEGQGDPSGSYEIHGCDGDFIHTRCKGPYRAAMDTFFAPGGPGSSAKHLESWLRGENEPERKPRQSLDDMPWM